MITADTTFYRRMFAVGGGVVGFVLGAGLQGAGTASAMRDERLVDTNGMFVTPEARDEAASRGGDLALKVGAGVALLGLAGRVVGGRRHMPIMQIAGMGVLGLGIGTIVASRGTPPVIADVPVRPDPNAGNRPVSSPMPAP